MEVRAEVIPREVALKVEKKEKPDRVKISISFNPQLPCISSIKRKHWRTMVQDPWMKEVFQNPPMVTYRRPPNLRDKLIRARIPDPPRMSTKIKINGTCKTRNVNSLLYYM